jgi:hypothetical protein
MKKNQIPVLYLGDTSREVEIGAFYAAFFNNLIRWTGLF